MPRWQSAFFNARAPADVLPGDRRIGLIEEGRLAADLSVGMEQEASRLERGLQLSIALDVLALGLVSVAYIVEKI